MCAFNVWVESDACLPKYLGVKGYFKTSSLVFSALAAHLFAAIVSSRCLLSANIPVLMQVINIFLRANHFLKVKI